MTRVPPRAGPGATRVCLTTVISIAVVGFACAVDQSGLGALSSTVGGHSGQAGTSAAGGHGGTATGAGGASGPGGASGASGVAGAGGNGSGASGGGGAAGTGNGGGGTGGTVDSGGSGGAGGPGGGGGISGGGGEKGGAGGNGGGGNGGSGARGGSGGDCATAGCPACYRCSSGACTLDPSSSWKLRCVSAQIADAKPNGDPWDPSTASSKNALPDPDCELWLGQSAVANTSVLSNTLTPGWNESVTPPGGVTASRLSSQSNPWSIRLLDDDGNQGSDPICTVTPSLIPSEFAAGTVTYRNIGSCTSVTITLECASP
jgi:hypothetical protein